MKKILSILFYFPIYPILLFAGIFYMAYFIFMGRFGKRPVNQEYILSEMMRFASPLIQNKNHVAAIIWLLLVYVLGFYINKDNF